MQKLGFVFKTALTFGVQNQWGEFVKQDIQSQEYGRSLSTVFGSPRKKYIMSYEEDDDPVLEDLRILDYRYMRFCYHTLKDKFILCNSWKDPAWTDVKTIRAGIDGDEKNIRESVFGKNLIDIKQKAIPQLLVDEVCSAIASNQFYKTNLLGLPPILCLPNRQFNSLVG
jgi:cation-transporting ATPase 13A2